VIVCVKIGSMSVTLYKEFDYSRSGSMVGNNINIRWNVNLEHYSIGDNRATLKSVHTLFGSNNHGFYGGNLEMSWSETSQNMYKADIGTSLAPATVAHRGIDLRWDGDSRSISYEPHMLIGDMHGALAHVSFSLSGKRSDTTSGPVFVAGSDGGVGQGLPLTMASEIGPISLALVFEFETIVNL
jgi:hypothetical protein